MPEFYRSPRPAKTPRYLESKANKPVLELFRVPVFRVHYKTLETYIENVFGFEFDFLMAAGVVEGLGVDYQITGKFSSMTWENKADLLRRGQRNRNVALILNTLACDGFIPKGQYTISTHPLPDPIDVYKTLLERTRSPLNPACIQFFEAQKDPGVRSKLEYINKVWVERHAA